MMLCGPPARRRTTVRPATAPSEGPSQGAILSAADGLMRGQPLKLDDPWAVAEIVDELNARRIDALQTNEYRAARTAKNAATAAREQFRQHDRDILHREVLARLDTRRRDAVDTFKAAKDDWKRQHQQMARDHKQELRDMDQKHDDEHRQLEQDWVQPEAIRRFDKRSAAMLQNRQMEQYMMLCGMYDRAEQMKRINARAEKAEMQGRRDEMSDQFEIARANLSGQQQKEVDKLKAQQDGEIRLLAEAERKDMAAKTKRVEASERVFAEEKDYEKFVAKKYKKPPSWILPCTVMTSKGASEDLPVIPRGKAAPAGSAEWADLRKRQFVTRLPLPPLAIRHYKPPSVLPKPRPKSSNA